MYKKKHKKQFNIIFADRNIGTFNKIAEISKDFNIINLNSSFAVNFVTEYEKIDILIIDNSIGNLDKIKKKAKKKNIIVYQIGQDLRFPLDISELKEKLNKEYTNYINSTKPKKSKISEFLPIFRFRPSSLKNNRKNKLENEKIQLNNKDRKFCKEASFNKDKNLVVKAIKQRTIIFLKAKGGVGSTILSIYLGYYLRKLKTLLIDLNFLEGGGDIGYYLCKPKYPNMVNFVSDYGNKRINESIINVNENLDLLQSPPTIELSKMIDLQDIYSLVDMAKRKYDILIFDLPNIINDLFLGVIDLADILVMITDHTIGSLARLVEINSKLDYEDLIKILVINKYNNLSEETIETFKNLLPIENTVKINYTDMLAQKTDYSDFNFGPLLLQHKLGKKIFELLISSQVTNK